ncbi:MAG: GNAT family N-acetyltransferase [Bacteroidales bacterium]
MEFRRITTDNDPNFTSAIGLYKISFPIHEQREDESQRNILNISDYHFGLIYDKDRFVGIILYWETNEFIYIEHFAIDPNMRNGGYGSKALNQLAKKGKTIILEIDPPIDKMSIRRKGFYERIGFCENQYSHIHPAYKVGFDGHSLTVMSYPTSISQEKYDNFKIYLDSVVMGA